MLSTHAHAFDVVSLTETWDQKSKRDEFLPRSIESSVYYNGLSGLSQKCGCGFLHLRKTCMIFDSYVYDNTYEFGAKWIEIINTNEKNVIIASVYQASL